jgi:hypothetical protein
MIYTVSVPSISRFFHPIDINHYAANRSDFFVMSEFIITVQLKIRN